MLQSVCVCALVASCLCVHQSVCVCALVSSCLCVLQSVCVCALVSSCLCVHQSVCLPQVLERLPRVRQLRAGRLPRRRGRRVGVPPTGVQEDGVLRKPVRPVCQPHHAGPQQPAPVTRTAHLRSDQSGDAEGSLLQSEAGSPCSPGGPRQPAAGAQGLAAWGPLAVGGAARTGSAGSGWSSPVRSGPVLRPRQGDLMTIQDSGGVRTLSDFSFTLHLEEHTKNPEIKARTIHGGIVMNSLGVESALTGGGGS